MKEKVRSQENPELRCRHHLPELKFCTSHLGQVLSQGFFMAAAVIWGYVYMYRLFILSMPMP